MLTTSRASRQSAPDPAATLRDEHPVIAGFRVGAPMGIGPLGTVYRAHNEDTGASVVFRGFSRPADADPAQWEIAERQFRDLLTAHQSLDDHPNIQKILGFGVDEGLFWIAAEYFEGVTLQTVIERWGAQSLPWALAVFSQIAAAVDWADDRGFSHTDLTPFNILLVTPEGPGAQTLPPADVVRVKVINFGLAHARPKFGSPYAAPEQMTGFEGDRQSDVYGAGALLYATLSGQAPFSGATPEAIARLIRSEPPATLEGRAPYVQHVLASMLDKNPSRRYGSVGQAINDLSNRRSPASAAGTAAADASGEPRTTAQQRPSSQPASDEATDGRFSRLELDPAPPIYSSASGPAGAATSAAAAANAAAATAAGHIALQDYRLSDQDLVEFRSFMETKRAEKVEAGRAKLRRTMRGFLIAAPVLGLFLLLWHAARVPDRYRVATVIGESGEAFVRRDGEKIALRNGDSFSLVGKDAANPVIIATGAGGRLLLDLAGTRLHLREGSSLAVRQEEYRSGPVRRFVLERGSVVAKVDPHHRASAVFEIASGGIRAIVKGTLFAVARSEGGHGSSASARVLVATQEGSVRVVSGGEDHAQVDAGHQIVVKAGADTLPEPTEMSDATRDVLDHSQQAIMGVPEVAPLAAALSRAEEQALLPMAEGLGTAAHLPSFMNDRRAQIQAVGAMQALCLLAQTAGASGEGLPAAIDLKSLKEFGMKPADNQRILTQFEGKQLISYRRLPDEGFEILAKANDSNHTLVRGRNGAASLVGNDDTEVGEAPSAGASPPPSTSP